MGFLVVRQLKKNLYFVCVLPYTNKGVQICSELLSPPPPKLPKFFKVILFVSNRSWIFGKKIREEKRKLSGNIAKKIFCATVPEKLALNILS